MASKLSEKVRERLGKLAASGADVADLAAFVAIPSVSAQPPHAPDVRRSAEFLRDRLRKAGMTAEVWETEGHPSVYAEWLGAAGGESAPTILIYGHHDVQPPEPVEQWGTPPFTASVRDGRLYGRGVVDDKGQVYCHVLALEALLQETGRLPCNVKVIVEGEEEVGSAHFDALIAKKKERLRADTVVVSDTPMLDRDHPSICYGLRGLAYLEVEVIGPDHDLHSGGYGGGVANPGTALAEILATLHDKKGRVAVAGFYDDVARMPGRERKALAKLPFDEAAWLRSVGAPAAVGELGWTTLERLWGRPTCDVMGVVGGYTGPGAKTILPARALAKVSCRLVPEQDPGKIASLLEAHVRKVAPPGVRVEVRILHGGKPWRAEPRHRVFKAAARALEEAFGKPTVFIREGGSIPFVRSIADILQVPCLLVGFGLPDENAHAPNEWLDLANFRKGTIACALLYAEVAASIRKSPPKPAA